MVTIKMLSGKFAGQSRVVDLRQVDPMELLAAAVRHGDHWRIDYSFASEEELFLWGRADLVCRAILAHQEGRPIFFDRQKFGDLQQLEDAIVDSGQMITIGRDDEEGFWVEAVGPEPKMH